jgi:uncharacterized membrane protein YedE/YeeE
MDLTTFLETYGDATAIAVAGAIVGLLFGAAAQRSEFCLRAACVEFWRGTIGARMAIWLLVFGVALAGVQALFVFGALEAHGIRQLSTPGTLSGAVIGGLMFGAGMILARGCASRLLVLSATGNGRALVAGLVLTVAAQASLTGILSPLRSNLSSLSVVPANVRDLSMIVPHWLALVAGLAFVAGAIFVGLRSQVSWFRLVMGFGVGFAVVLGFGLTALIASQSFEIVPIQSVTFTGPSADTLSVLIVQPDVPLNFGLGLIPGVFAGSLIAALASGTFKLQTFTEETPLPRYLAGAVLMGFGSMLAGGCAVGAGVTGGSLLALTAWVALFAMWIGAGLTDRLVDVPQTDARSKASPAFGAQQ